MSYLQAAQVVTVNMSDGTERWGAFQRLARQRASSIEVLEHLDGTRFVRTGWFFDHVRRCDYAAGSNGAIATRMERVDWKRRGKTGRIKATSPSFPGTLVWSFFDVPAGWETDQAGAR